MKSIVLALAACLSFALVADAQPAAVAKSGKAELTPEEFALERLKRTGGNIVKPGSQRGTIAFVDTQSRLAHSNLVAVARALNEELLFNIVATTAKPATPDAVLRGSGASLAVIVVDDADSPALLVAPEDRWACVNVAKLDKGLKSDAARRKFFEPRARRELYRAFSMLCGGAASQYRDNLPGCATQLEMDLCPEMLPVDIVARCAEYLPKLDVTRRFVASYSRACREGWAPPPTNEYQQAVWKRIHEMPKKPLKLEKPAK